MGPPSCTLFETEYTPHPANQRIIRRCLCLQLAITDIPDPDFFFLRTHEKGCTLGRHRHVAGIGHQRLSVNCEAVGQLDRAQNVADRICGGPVLRNGCQLGHAGGFNCPSLVKFSSASALLAKRIADKTGNSCLLRMCFIRTSEYVEGSFYRK